ncbi:MAG: hypothetical protein AAB835_00965, partial [Patescibacteria group bacterium]
MNISELKKLAENARYMRESGIALLFVSGILALFLFLSPTPEYAPTEPITIVSSAAPDAFADISLEAKAAIVYDLATGNVLYEKNAYAQLPLASLTKLLTVYSALVKLSPDTPVTIPPGVSSIEGQRTFNVGQTFSLSDLARLTLTASLNDGAAAIASATAERGNRPQNEMLASAAAALNLSQTYAVNGSGLDENSAISGGYGSAYDIARLSGALVDKAPDISAATTLDSVQAVSAGGTSFSVKNTDPMVGAIPRLLLSKTGYTDLAGGNLALVFDVGIGHPIAIVVLGSSLKS